MVIATGVHTFFGKVALIDSTNQVVHFQKVILAMDQMYFNLGDEITDWTILHMMFYGV